MDRGDLDEMSFAFRVTRQEWSPDYSQRDITEVNLNKGDVSIVNYGANPHTAGLTSLRTALADPSLDRDRLLEMLRGFPELSDLLAPRGELPAPEAERSEDLALYEARLRLLKLA
jgi:hypothetical protein